MNKKREMVFLVSFLLLFGIIFLVILLNQRRHLPVLGLGIDYEVENWTFLVLSLLAILRVFWMIVRNS